MSGDLTRRQLLGLAAGGALGAVLAKAGAAQAATTAPLADSAGTAGLDRWWAGEGPQAGFPRAFIFRQSEVLARQLPYEEFEQKMLALGGFEGKAVGDTFPVVPNAIEYYTRFKAAHPDKLVLLHIAHQRLPTFQSRFFFPGHMLFRAGTRLTAPVGADPASSVLQVADISIFRAKTGNFNDRGDDICATLTHADGTPDWNRAEEMRLLSIDTAASSITVARGSHDTQPMALPTGAYLAPHVIYGPEDPEFDMRWQYNFSTVCPRDDRGRNCIDAYVEALYDILGPAGTLANLDGFETDTMTDHPVDHPLHDCNGDGIADAGIFKGVDTFVEGHQQFQQNLRQRLGPQKLILADGGDQASNSLGGTSDQPNAMVYNGVERERWHYVGDDPRIFWSTGLNLGSYWLDTDVPEPRLSYFLAKFRARGELFDGLLYPAARTIFAAAALVGAAASFFTSPNDSEDLQPATDPNDAQPYTYTIYDELVAGVRNEPNWLGMPADGQQRLAPRSPDLLKASGISWPDDLVARISGPNVTIARQTQGSGTSVVVTPTSGQTDVPSCDVTFDFSLSGVQVPGNDLTVDATMYGSPMGPQYPDGMGRMVQVFLEGSSTTIPRRGWINSDSRLLSFYFADLAPGNYSLNFVVQGNAPITLDRLVLYPAVDARYRQFAQGAVFVNPSFAPYTFDLSQLPGGLRPYRRLQATPSQDVETNNGAPIGSALTLPPTDALFVQAEQ